MSDRMIAELEEHAELFPVDSSGWVMPTNAAYVIRKLMAEVETLRKALKAHGEEAAKKPAGKKKGG